MVLIFLKVVRIGDREKFFPILPILVPEIGMPNTEYIVWEIWEPSVKKFKMKVSRRNLVH